MKNENSDRVNFVDALEGRHAYAVLTKDGRVQILVQPTKKELRKRGKRSWHLFDTVADAPDAGETLLKTIRLALQSLESDDETAKQPKPKKKAGGR